MLESILDAVKGEIVSTVQNETGLGPREAEQTVPLARESVSEGITGALSGGNLGGILDMLKGSTGGGGLLQNAVFQGIAAKFIHKLTGQLGLSEGVAQKVANLALPIILGKLAGRTRAAGDTDEIDKGSLLDVLGLDAGDILGNVAGGLLGGKGQGTKGSGGFGNLFG